jgi:hypothetical protein
VDNTDSDGYFHGKGSRRSFSYTVKSTTIGFDSREQDAKRAEKRKFGEYGSPFGSSRLQTANAFTFMPFLTFTDRLKI